MAKDPLAPIADELYGLVPAEFTAARNARAKEAKDAADPELAKRVTALRKPSPAAWGVNLLARERGEQLTQLAELGEAMRDATQELDRAGLAELTRQRRALVNALAREAATLASAQRHNLTQSVQEEVAQTLQAALNDPNAAAAVLSGRLMRSLEGTGLEAVDLTDAVAAPDANMTSAPRAAPHRAPVRDLAAVRAAKEASKRADEAEAEVSAVERRIEQVAQSRDRLESRLADLEEQIRLVEDELREVDRDARSLARERDKARARAEDLRAEADRLRG